MWMFIFMLIRIGMVLYFGVVEEVWWFLCVVFGVRDLVLGIWC